MSSRWVNEQQQRNQNLLQETTYVGDRFESSILPLHLDLQPDVRLDSDGMNALIAVQKEAARIALSSLASLAKIGELDHLGGGLELIPAFSLTQAVLPAGQAHYTIEHAHTSIGYYSTLAALGYLDEQRVIEYFRRSLDIAGHVSWVPGGTELNGGRLGVMIPAAVGHALGLRARAGDDAWYICHCGDAGWISGQALNGFNGAAVHKAPMTFVMHRNGIQLSGTTARMMDVDPRPVISSLGIEILEISSVADMQELNRAYAEGKKLAAEGTPNLIYPTGLELTLEEFGNGYGVLEQTQAFAQAQDVAMDRKVWIPGSLMSYRDFGPMMECIFLVNGLPGGAGHHDGHMKGRDLEEVLANPMMILTDDETKALEALKSANPTLVVSEARPSPGTANLVVSKEQTADIELPEPGKAVSARAGVQEGYYAVARAFPEDCFFVSCDLNASTKLGKGADEVPDSHAFEMSIEEQVAGIMTNGLAVSSRKPQLNVVSTFSAFFEGIAREACEMWRYQRNLNGSNEGLNAAFHLSHVGACTGRDHFSGWSLDWITLGLGYLPYLDRFYTPSDARAAFIAVLDLAARYGGHIIGVPRDNLPILTKQGSDEPLFDQAEAFEPMTCMRANEGATKAILAVGATAYLACDVAEASGEVDAYVMNGFPLESGALSTLAEKYSGGLVSIEDGIIAEPEIGLRGFAAMAQSAAMSAGVPFDAVGITDPTIAPAEGHEEVWAHFGITREALQAALDGLDG